MHEVFAAAVVRLLGGGGGGGETKVKFSELTINVMQRVLSQSKFGSILLERLISYLISKQARLNAF